MPTPHNSAACGDFAKTVLMPGDPLRAQYIAETYLEDARLVNNVRGIQGYTGTYKGTPVSVMASGMGMPTIGIYSYELYNFYGVENIMRIGSVGALSEKLHLRDLILAQGACTDSSYAAQFGCCGTIAPIADYGLLRTAADIAEERKLGYAVGNLLSSDVFYNDNKDFNAPWIKMGVLGVEMESAALYLNAMRAGKRALSICTVSDHILTGEAMTAEARQTSFHDMMELALEVAVRI